MTPAAAPDVMSKAAFAALCNASPSRLSHWIRDGKIGPEALEGTGRTARIRVPVALAQLRARRDVGQALGNGIDVRLGAPPPPAPQTLIAAASLPPAPIADAAGGPARVPAQHPDWLDPVEERIKREKLDALERTNRIAAAKEAADAGRYVEAAAARREMARIAAGMVQVLEQALDTFATAIAERFQVPQRDALHLLKGEFRKVRERAAEAHARQADALPRTVEVADDPESPNTTADPEPDQTD